MKLFQYIEQQIKYLLFSVLKLRCRGRRGHISPGTDLWKLLLYQNIVQVNLSLPRAVSLVHKNMRCIQIGTVVIPTTFKHLKMFCCLNFLRAIHFPLMSVSGFCAQLSNCVGAGFCQCVASCLFGMLIFKSLKLLIGCSKFNIISFGVVCNEMFLYENQILFLILCA